MTDKFGNLLSPDRNNETGESKCCKQLGSEVLTLNQGSKLTFLLGSTTNVLGAPTEY